MPHPTALRRAPRQSLFVVVSAVIASAVAGEARAQGTLFAVDSNRNVYQINAATGAATLAGVAPPEVGVPAGLAFDPATQTVYLTSTNFDSLYRYDLLTSTAILIGPYGVIPDFVMHGLEFDTSTGTLYGASTHDGGVYTINTATGTATLVGLTGQTTNPTNLVHDPFGNVMYATSSNTDSFYSVNRATGALTLIGALGGPTNPNGLAFNTDDGLIYLVDNNTDSLYTINPATGAATLIGATGTDNLLGLVFIPVPEPTTWATASAIGLAGLFLCGRRRRRATS